MVDRIKQIVFKVFHCRFPCPVVNCNKEYRTQWELNSHQRLKHSKAEPTIDQIAEPEQAEQIESISLITNATEERPYEQLPSTSSNGKTIYNRRKRKNTQQIIYVMPGPIENVRILILHWTV